MRNGSKYPRPTKLKRDIFYKSCNLLSWELESDTKPRRLAGVAQYFLIFPFVNFNNNAINQIIFLFGSLLPPLPIRNYAFNIFEFFEIRIDLESKFPQKL